MGQAGLDWAICVGLLVTPGCSDDPPALEPAPAPPTDPARPGKVEPAPHSELALGRAVFEDLQRDDWVHYTNVLVTRADMMALFRDADRGEGRERRRRRRMVWRRVNRLRDGGAERGWKEVRRSARDEGLSWDAARLVDVRHEPTPESAPGSAGAERFGPDTVTARLRLVIEHREARLGIDLGLCARTPRGWVVLYPMQWLGAGDGEPFGESLLAPPSAP